MRDQGLWYKPTRFGAFIIRTSSHYGNTNQPLQLARVLVGSLGGAAWFPRIVSGAVTEGRPNSGMKGATSTAGGTRKGCVLLSYCK